MDEKALRDKLMARAATAVDEMMAAMKKASKNNIIGGSEWQVRDAGDKFKRECFEELVADRVAETEAGHKRSFSPGGAGVGGGGAGEGSAVA